MYKTMFQEFRIRDGDANSCRDVRGKQNSVGFPGRQEGMARGLNMEKRVSGLSEYN